jgi:hypothetical protein
MRLADRLFRRECDQFLRRRSRCCFPRSRSKKLIALAPVLLFAVLLVFRNGRSAAEREPAAVVFYADLPWSGVSEVRTKASKSADLAVSHHPARVGTFTVPWHGLASGAGSDGRVKGATLAGPLR